MSNSKKANDHEASQSRPRGRRRSGSAVPRAQRRQSRQEQVEFPSSRACRQGWPHQTSSPSRTASSDARRFSRHASCQDEGERRQHPAACQPSLYAAAGTRPGANVRTVRRAGCRCRRRESSDSRLERGVEAGQPTTVQERARPEGPDRGGADGGPRQGAGHRGGPPRARSARTVQGHPQVPADQAAQQQEPEPAVAVTGEADTVAEGCGGRFHRPGMVAVSPSRNKLSSRSHPPADSSHSARKTSRLSNEVKPRSDTVPGRRGYVRPR